MADILLITGMSGAGRSGAAAPAESAALAADWPEFLGPGGRGIAIEPIRSSWGKREGIAWRIGLPGRGNSSPIVVGDLVVVTACSGSRQDLLHVIACDVHSGAVRWHRTLWATGQTGCQGQTSVAASTPASDGKRIVAFFISRRLMAPPPCLARADPRRPS